jgi:hypothetical protein
MNFLKFRNTTLSFLALILISACKQEAKIGKSISGFPIEIEPIPQIIEIPPVLTNTDALKIADSLLVALNSGSRDDKIFHVFKIPCCMYMGSFGTYGKGPDEFVNPITNTMGSTSHSIYVVDNMLVKEVLIKSFDNQLSLNITKTPLPGKLSVVNGLLKCDSFIIGHTSNLFLEKEFFHYSISGKSIKQFSDYPEIFKSQNITQKTYYPLYLKSITLRPDGQKFAALYSNFPLLRIFDVNNMNLEESIFLENAPKQIIEIGSEGTISTKLSYSFYLDICSTPKYIYGLFLGKKPSDLEATPGVEVSTNVHVWDWNGVPIASIELKNTELRIAVDKEDRFLYTISPYSVSKLYRYEIKQIQGLE